MLGCPSSRAFSWARTTTERACVVNRSNTGLPPPREEPPPRVLLVHRLPAHAELVGDLLPGPIGLSGVPNLERFELLEEFPECGDRVQADPRIRVSRGAGELGGLAHVGCQCTLTALVVSTLIDEIEGRTLPWTPRAQGTIVNGSVQVARAAIRSRALRTTLIAFLCFSVAEWTRWVALLVYGFDRAGAAGSGLIAVIQLVPAAALTPFTSSLADRFDRPRVLLAGYLVAALGTTAGGVAIVLDAPFAVVAILSAVGLCGVTLIRPTQASLLPRLVTTPGELTAANAVVSFITGSSVLAGPALAAVLMTVSGPSATLTVAGVFLAIGALTTASVQRSSAGSTAPSQPVDLFGGFREIARNPGAGLVLILLGLQAITWGAVDVLIVGLAIDELGLGRSGAGWLAAAVGVGGVIGGAATVSLVGRSRLTPGFAFGVSLWGFPLVAIAVLLAPVPVIVCLSVAGVGYAFMDVSGRTLLQRAVDERALGRVFGLLEAGFMAAWAIGSAIAPVALGALTLRWTFAALGLAVPFVTAIGWRRLRRIDAEAWVPTRELALMRSIDIFAPLRGPVLEFLARELKEVDVPAGRTLIHEGEPGDRFYAIVDGEVSVSAGGKEIARLGPGGYVGEIALLRDVPRQASVTTVADTRLLALDREPFLEAVTGSRRAAAVARSGVERRLAELEPHDRA